MRRLLCLAFLALAAPLAVASDGSDLISAPDQSVSTAEAPARDIPNPDVLRFVINDIRFTKSEILSAEELESVARDFRGRELGLADLKQVSARVNEVYRLKGIITAQAMVPAQNLSPGVALIRLVEGRLGQVQVKGNSSTEESYVVARLGLKPDELMDLAALKEALIRFNRTNDAQLRCELAPGKRFATTDLIVLVKEPQRRDLKLSYDSLGAASTGKQRTGLSFLDRSLFGFRDDCSLAITQAAGQRSLAGSYGFPFNTLGGRLNLGYSADRTSIINGSLETLNITGEALIRQVSLRQPLLVDAAKKIDLVVGGKQRRSSNWSEDVLMSSAGTTDRSIGLEAQLLSSQSNLFASYTRSAVKAVGGGESYLIDRGALRYKRDFPGGLSFHGSLAWQSADKDGLPSSDQFMIGGEGSVRGYPVGFYSGDTGYALGLELIHPIAAADAEGNGASGFFFVDCGRVEPFRPPNSSLAEHESLLGAGWGLNADLSKALHARLTFGYGLTRLTDQPRSYEITMQCVSSLF